jgi:diguanylate cyclase (GGDEF)-like protein/PAS domain S-box-containing protein
MAMQKVSMSSGTILLPQRFREAPTEPREDPLETIDRHSPGLVLGYAEADDRFFPEWQRAEMTLDSIGDGVISVDKAGSVTYLNPVAERMTGWSRAEASGRTLSDVFRVVDGDTREPAPSAMDQAVRGDKTVGFVHNAVLIRRDGIESAIEDSVGPIHDHSGEIIGAVMIFRDVSKAREAELRLRHLAQHDVLTGLPNRLLLNDRLSHAISLARRHGKLVAVLFLDLDRFKLVNDFQGHAVGDKLLQEIAKRLRATVRDSDTVARQGGDEFVVVLSELEHARHAARHAEKIHAALSGPNAIAQRDFRVEASIGISIFPDDGQDADTLIRCADAAMYRGKMNGRNSHQFFRPETNVRAAGRHALQADLRRAMERHQLVLHYQPKMDVETGAITGAEALVRWAHPEHGLLAPEQFLPIAEDCDLIVPIGQWVVREACRQNGVWQKARLPKVTVSVNVSRSEFRHQGFVHGVRAVLARARVEPRYLELEIPESVLMQDGEFSAVVLQGLESLGIGVTIDEFGTGYSNLKELRRFPVNALKVDQSFVRNSTHNRDDAAVVSAAISLGRSLGRRVIAGGVETREQLAFLRTRFCDEGQGYYFSPPVFPDEFADLIGATARPPFASTQITTFSAR